jgi:hypothetical protein
MRGEGTEDINNWWNVSVRRRGLTKSPKTVSTLAQTSELGSSSAKVNTGTDLSEER